ncbi:MAG TPA: hypothetical protein VK674_04905 [Candidatus Limnocylindria bacterium]|nr:hypothetical protein [Candidatus Limnocylindria bacterium]
MHKRKLHHLLVALRPISYWYFVVIFIVSGFAAAYALRQNNLGAIERRDHLLQVDKQNGDVEVALKELRGYTYSHMNAGLASDTGIYPPIQLKYTYDRLVAAEKVRVEGANRDVYAEAQRDCERRFPLGLSGSNRLPCIRGYIDAHGKAEAQPHEIPDGLYKFDFVSPAWSPDLAGWSLVVAGLALLLLIVRTAAQLWLRHQLSD